MKEDGNTLESFGRRVRGSEQAARKVHDQKTRFAAPQKTRYEKSERYERKPAWKEEISTERIQKLVKKVSPKEAESRTKEEAKNARKPADAASSKTPDAKRPPPRPCKHCGGKHWDIDCKDKKVLFNAADDDSEDDTVLDEEDLATYEELQAAAAEMDSDSSKNED